jgi:hypothetical protein
MQNANHFIEKEYLPLAGSNRKQASVERKTKD